MQFIVACNPNLPTEGWKFIKNPAAVSGVAGEEWQGDYFGFLKVEIITYKSYANAVKHPKSDYQMREVEQDHMKSSSDVESIEQGECSSGLGTCGQTLEII